MCSTLHLWTTTSTLCCLFQLSGDHQDLPGLTHAFPTRRSSDLLKAQAAVGKEIARLPRLQPDAADQREAREKLRRRDSDSGGRRGQAALDRKSTRLNSSH